MKAIALTLAAAMLAACAQHPVSKTPSTSTQPIPAALAVFAGPILPTTVFREGDWVNFTVLAFVPQHLYRLQLSTTCSGDKGHLAYLNEPRQVYPDSVDGLYAAQRPLKKDELEQLRNHKAFAQLCTANLPADWRLVRTAQDGTQVYVDRANIVTTGTLRNAWVLDDYVDEHPEAPYMAPVAQTRRYVTFDCAHETMSNLHSYDLNAAHQVTDMPAAATTASNVLTDLPQYRPVYAAVCGDPQALATLPVYLARIKRPTEVEHLYVQPAVVEAVRRLDLPAPRKALHYLQIIGTVTGPTGSQGIDEEQFVQRDASSDLWHTTRRTENSSSSRTSWRGILALIDHTHYQTLPVRDVTAGIENISFFGDWKNLPVGSQVSFEYDATHLDSLKPYAGAFHQTTECAVQSEGPASAVNAQLSGKAKQMVCHWLPDFYKRSFTYQYLEDYGYFFDSHMDSNPVGSYDRYLHAVQ